MANKCTSAGGSAPRPNIEPATIHLRRIATDVAAAGIIEGAINWAGFTDPWPPWQRRATKENKTKNANYTV